ncbi:alpha-L-fucosidase [Arachidicoccus terrestris]|uniref:alpha-L-fucosidase n=1 Tax=Arachidicoccus terrestris TaxID=2875539 RepID=UPI001CC5143E|nr:alpha-L-fucosidase [Arachidicoccus terrestris]UAY54175.1 alpha-L-fucosidase [Arachidicoccus terrestris]
MRKVAVVILCLSSFLSAVAQVKGDEDKDMFNKVGDQRDAKAVTAALNGWWTASMKNHDRRIQWWRDARFGMFVHWGIYSLAGGEWKGKEVGGYAEHLMRKEKISRKEYLELASRFNPVKFDADQWIAAAKNAGMRYFVITAKHHDGFAMYPSKVSDFNISAKTPYKKDPMAALRAACKKQGLKFGFYYSHAFDWEHPDAPGNDWEYKNPGGDLQLYGGRDWYNLHPDLLRKVQKYVNGKAIPQILELIQKYHPDILWFDTPHKLPLSENLRILQAIRKVDSTVVINGRLVRSSGHNFGDYKNTADRPAEFYPVAGDWEAIPTTNESYGYSKFDHSHKPAGHFIRLLASAAAKGGNLLMNIGPMGTGEMASEDLTILSGIGRWMQNNGESIYGTTATPLPLQSWGVSTYKPGKLYLHVFNYPTDGKLYVGGLVSTCKRAYLLTDKGRRLSVSRSGKLDLTIGLPDKAPDTVNTVVVLELATPEKFDSIRFLAPNVSMTRMLAYDALLVGKGFGFGDGKRDRYYVNGWSSAFQTLSWKFRNDQKLAFRVVLKRIRNTETGGTCNVLVDGKLLTTIRTEPSRKGDLIENMELGDITLEAGEHQILIQPTQITERELMRPLELQLIKK